MSYELYLCHHGIKGMHWGIRRYQNADGSYTSAGKKRRKSADPSAQEGKRNLRKKAAAAIATTAFAGAGAAAAIASRSRHDADSRSKNESGNKDSLGKTLFSPSIKERKRTVSPAEKGLEETTKTFRNLQNLNEHVSKISKQKSTLDGPTKKQSSDLAKMSDRDLEQTIRRMNLERQYISMTKPPTRKTGYEKVNDVLSVAGDLSAIALSVATVAGTAYKIKHG